MKGSSKPAIARRAFTAHSAFEASAVLEHEQGSSNPQAETERCGDEDRETRTKASELRLDFDRGGGLHNQRMLAQESLPLLVGPADNRARDGRALLVGCLVLYSLGESRAENAWLRVGRFGEHQPHP